MPRVAGLLLKPQPMALRRSAAGFSLVELLIVVAFIGTMAAVALPVMKDMTASIKLNDAARMVQRELDGARLKAVSANRVMRVRTNCPATGYLRRVEVVTAAVDNASNRCLDSAYPFPAADNDIMTRPNFDGPVRTLPAGCDRHHRQHPVFARRHGQRGRVQRAAGHRDGRDADNHPRRKVQDGNGQWHRQDSTPVAAASA